MNQPTPPDYTSYVEARYPETCKEYKRLQQEEYAVFCRKQHDYGSGNISLGSSLTTEEDIYASLCSIIFRQFDKVQRLLNLIVKRPGTSPANEPVEDAFGDLACYSKIAMIVKAGKWGK